MAQLIHLASAEIKLPGTRDYAGRWLERRHRTQMSGTTHSVDRAAEKVDSKRRANSQSGEKVFRERQKAGIDMSIERSVANLM